MDIIKDFFGVTFPSESKSYSSVESGSSGTVGFRVEVLTRAALMGAIGIGSTRLRFFCVDFPMKDLVVSNSASTAANLQI